MSLVNIFGNKIPAAAGGGGGPYTDIKSVVLDFADNHGHALYVGVTRIEFYSSGSRLNITPADYGYGHTSAFSAAYFGDNAFDSGLTKVGGSSNRSWLAANGSPTNQRIFVTFHSVKTFDRIDINNYHDSGGATDAGAQNAKIQVTTDTGAISTVYNSAVTGGVTIFNSTFPEHAAVDAAQDFTLTLV